MQNKELLNEQISALATKQNENKNSDSEIQSETQFVGAICPNCGAQLEGRKCKLFCPTRGCGYVVTCSEW
jgi:hypothetical protein